MEATLFLSTLCINRAMICNWHERLWLREDLYSSHCVYWRLKVFYRLRTKHLMSLKHVSSYKSCLESKIHIYYYKRLQLQTCYTVSIAYSIVLNIYYYYILSTHTESMTALIQHTIFVLSVADYLVCHLAVDYTCISAASSTRAKVATPGQVPFMLPLAGTHMWLCYFCNSMENIKFQYMISRRILSSKRQMRQQLRSSKSHKAAFSAANLLQPSQSKPEDSREEPVEDVMMFQALTSGSGIWEETEDKHWVSSTAPQPCSRSWGHTGWSPAILPRLCLPTATQPPLPLPAFTGAVHKPGPQCPWVINGVYGADGFLPSSALCCYASLSFAFIIQHWKNPPTQMQPTINCSSTTREPALQLEYMN